MRPGNPGREKMVGFSLKEVTEPPRLPPPLWLLLYICCAEDHRNWTNGISEVLTWDSYLMGEELSEVPPSADF
ncbi:hypothetical protein OJAV_G00138260 [Oryzias javanicus]|uniref:Uncharacterized protein n=1 Tax=Oryzias javanicus TaxID=123683 RepID=A0A437CLG7_ORYJA|nr:hypothetical protein OJAV_G00138260 [Oryzias javanicus]